MISAVYSILSFPFIPLNGLLIAHERFIELRMCEIAQKFIIVLLMSICLLCGYGLYALVSVNAISGIIMISMKVYFLKQRTSQGLMIKYYDKTEFQEIARYSGWITVIAFAQRCIFSIAPTILGVFSGSSAIAILSIAMTLEGYTFTFTNALNGMFIPRVNRIVSNKGGDVLPLMIKIGRIQIYVVAFIVLGLVLLGQDFINLWVGKDFLDSYLCTILIVFPSLFYLPQDIGIQTIYVKNKVKEMSYCYILMALLNLIIAFILTPRFGVIGLCLSIGIAYTVRTICIDIVFRRDLDIDIFLFFKKTFLALFVPLFIIMLLGLIMNVLIVGNNWCSFIYKAIIYVFVYLVVMFPFMNMEEKKLILGCFHSKNMYK